MASPPTAAYNPYVVYPPQYFPYPHHAPPEPRRPPTRAHPLYHQPYPHFAHPQQHPQFFLQHQHWQPPHHHDVNQTPAPLQYQHPAPASPAPSVTEMTKTHIYTTTGSILVSSISSSSSAASSSHPSPALQTTLLSPLPTLTDSAEKSQKPPQPRTAKQKLTWAIWSRRPTDPSNAPAIIISPQAHPPPDVVQQALELRTPPPSPPPLPSATLPITCEQKQDDDENNIKNENENEHEHGTPQISAAAPADSSTVPSSATSAIDNLSSSTVPGSPVSSTTSVSLSAVAGNGNGALPVEENKVEETTPTDEAAAIGTASTATIATVATTTPLSPSPASASSPAPSPAPAQPKKSWASLLKTSDSSSGSGKNTLPTSHVVGISIPASYPNHAHSPGEPSSSSGGASSGASAAHGRSSKAELAALLSGTAPAPSAPTLTPTSTTPATTIRPRGLINSGNMCFATAVLQMLVYTPPFQRLFVELGRLKGVVVVGKDLKDRGKEGTPLVDAMIEFVKEFVVPVDGGGGGLAVNGWGGGGKGKEKERESEWGDGGRDEGMWEGESFVPTYVYDAMKEKKRFDNMRGGQQEDAEEFLGFLLETLEEELVLLREEVTGRRHTPQQHRGPVEEKEEAAPSEDVGWQEVGKRNRTVVTRTIQSTETSISKMFGGKFRTTLRVPTKKDSVIVEDWRSVRLDIQRDEIHTVQDALSYISDPQPVLVTHPSRPGATLVAEQQVHIHLLPPILVLYMKRFCYDTSVGGVVKVGKQVRFEPELDIPNDVIAPGIRKSWSPKYKLFGVLYHHGMSASGGHYTLDVLHPTRFAWGGAGAKAREGWVRIDDELVSDVRHEDVFGAWERDDTRSAYLLFYSRVR